jgi:hypothetical protein
MLTLKRTNTQVKINKSRVLNVLSILLMTIALTLQIIGLSPLTAHQSAIY